MSFKSVASSHMRPFTLLLVESEGLRIPTHNVNWMVPMHKIPYAYIHVNMFARFNIFLRHCFT